CFKGTREVLLREMADWATGPGESRMYVLSGLAGIGKSTIAYTIASRAADLGLLGASFFFSRDEADRKNAERFFTTIAYQLCVFNETFSKAIGDVLLTERGSAATTKGPQEQLQALIVDPLRSIVQSRSRPILIVVDALDECDEEDGESVLTGLKELVQHLPSFKVILTTRPQPYLDHFLRSQGGLRIFHLQDIEDKIVDGDIRLYLQHCLSLEEVQRRYPRRKWCASDEGIDSLVHAAGRLFIVASTAVRYIFDKSASNPAAQMKKLLNAFAQAYTPFKDLDYFYTVILRNVIPDDCDDDDIVDRYRSVVGGIIFVQQPLPVSTLAHLIDTDVEDIHAKDEITDEQLEEKIPQILHYACAYWVNHLQVANVEDPNLMNGLEKFADAHMLYWLEVLSLIGKLDKAHVAIRVVLKLLSTSSDLHQLLSDALRFISKFYEVIERSALHTYYSALPFAPTKSVLYRRYLKETADNICSIEGGPEKWDALVATLNHEEIVNVIKFSFNSTWFVSSSGKFEQESDDFSIHNQGKLKIWDTATGTPISTIPGHRFAVASDFSTVVSSEDKTLAYLSANGIVKLRDGISGRSIADLQCGSGLTFDFSGDGSRIASLSEDRGLALWNSESGALIGAVKPAGADWHTFAISANESLLATADDDKVTLLYDVKTHAFISTLPFRGLPMALALSPDCTHFAVGAFDGGVYLWNIRRVDVSNPSSEEYHSEDAGTAVTALALSRDCSRLACGFEDGKVELWEISPTKRRIAFHQTEEAHKDSVRALGFSPDGRLFAAELDNGLLKLWNGKDGSLRGTLQLARTLRAMELSNRMLVARDEHGWRVTLWNLDT
ncbi:hypothetical protein M378DRAFT_51824, partial [Amanita muscaria Koide BX008]